MNEIKCRQCGSTDVMIENWFYVCQNCKSKYSLDASGIESKKSDDLFDAGKTALQNDDYRNATNFFKNAMEINPKNGQAFHYYNLASDLYYLLKGGIKSVPILVKSLKSKMGTIIDMYLSITNEEIRNCSLLDAIHDFDMLCQKLAFVITQKDKENEEKEVPNKNESHKKYGEYFEYIFDSYKSSISKLTVNNSSKEIINDINNKYNNFIKMNSFYSKYNDNFTNKHSFANKKDAKSGDSDFVTNYRSKRSIFLRLFEWISDIFDEIWFSIDSEIVIRIILTISSVVLLFITALNIKNNGEIGNIVFFAIATIACIFGAYQVFNYEEEIPVLFRTIIWIAIDYFVLFDFGFGFSLIWRIVIGIVLFALSYKIFDEIL